MGYLIPADYNRLIQEVSLQQIISGDLLLKYKAEITAITEVKSYLRAKYDVEAEFTDTTVYSHGAAYKAANRVYLDAPAYNNAATYILAQLVLQSGKVYACSTAITVAEPFTIAHWLFLGNQYDIFYCQYPKPLFDLNNGYNKGDEVFWKNKVYTCLIGTPVLDHDTILQFGTTSNIPNRNVFPDDPNRGSTFWGNGIAYTVPAGKIVDTAYFTNGDNRNQQLVVYTMDVLIYHLYRRIPPAVVPEIRIVAYRSCIEWLKNVAKGSEVTADIQKIQPPQGGRLRAGSNIKNQNNY